MTIQADQTTAPPRETHAHEEVVVVRTLYPGQYLRVRLERTSDRLGLDGYRHIEQIPQAELIIEPGCRVTIGSHGLRVEPLE